jgi:hypothetical protein
MTNSPTPTGTDTFTPTMAVTISTVESMTYTPTSTETDTLTPTATATMMHEEYTLTIDIEGSGSVIKAPEQATYHYADVVRLTAVPNLGWRFGNWSPNVVDGNITINADTTVTATFIQNLHSISLYTGWNLVSFNLHPTDTAITSVLSSISGNYDLVYAWDATGAHSSSGNWMMYDPDVPPFVNSLADLDETMGFWINMTSADTLDITGTVPVATSINLSTNAGGWNLIAYPSGVNRAMPAALSDNGIGTDFSLVYAYHANVSSPWMLFDLGAPPFVNSLTELAPGWGYWVKVSADNTWNVGY